MKLKLKMSTEKTVLIATTSVGVLLFTAMLIGIFLPQTLGSAVPWLGLACAVLLVVVLVYGFYVERKMCRERDAYRYHDQVTGLPNAGRLQMDFQGLKEKKREYVFVLIRLQGYYRLTSLFGVTIGGALISKLGELLTGFAKERGGLAYRTGQNRFVLLVSAPEQESFTKDLEQLFVKLERVQVETDGVRYSHHYTFHYGVYFLSEADEQVQEFSQVLATTNEALLRMDAVKNTTTGIVFSQQTKPDWELQKILDERMQEAWEAREFVPYYQLVYTLRNKKPVGAETLTRWEFPGRGTILPGDFLPVMQHKGLIMDLDLYMLEEACKKIKGWIDAELVTVPLSVNIAKLNIHRADFVDRVIATVRAYDIPPILLEMELSEAVLLYEKTPEFLAMCDRLRHFGVSLSMDNFAVNDFSSINMLRDLPLDVVKIGRYFFDRVNESERERVFVTSVVQMLKEMGVKIIVVGVETEEQARLYREYGCEYGQGYYFSKPISNDEFEKIIF